MSGGGGLPLTTIGDLLQLFYQLQAQIFFFIRMNASIHITWKEKLPIRTSERKHIKYININLFFNLSHKIPCIVYSDPVDTSSISLLFEDCRDLVNRFSFGFRNLLDCKYDEQRQQNGKH